MIFKKILFALPAFAIAIAFSFCTKEPAPTSAALPDQQAATERWQCKFTLTATDQASICGTVNAPLVPCQECLGGQNWGFALFGNGVVHPWQPAGQIMSSSIRNLSQFRNFVEIRDANTGWSFGRLMMPGECAVLTPIAPCEWVF